MRGWCYACITRSTSVTTPHLVRLRRRYPVQAFAQMRRLLAAVSPQRRRLRHLPAPRPLPSWHPGESVRAFRSTRARRCSCAPEPGDLDLARHHAVSSSLTEAMTSFSTKTDILKPARCASSPAGGKFLAFRQHRNLSVLFRASRVRALPSDMSG